MPLRSMPESLETMTSGLILHFRREQQLYDVQLPLHLGIFRTAICKDSKTLIDT